MRGKTLHEKNYGPGIRPGTVHSSVAIGAPDRCFAERGDHPCSDPVAGRAELWVDETPPKIDAYSRLLARLPVQRWCWVPLCMGHLTEVSSRSADDQVEDAMWAPGAANPAVLPRPPKLIGARDGSG